MANPSQPSIARRDEGKLQFAPLGSLIEYKIENLFGEDGNNYTFTLDSVEPTLLTGVNGTGKSTILRTIEAISTGRWQQLIEIPFTFVELTFSTDRKLAVNRTPSGARITLTGTEEWEYKSSSSHLDELLRTIDPNIWRVDLDRSRADLGEHLITTWAKSDITRRIVASSLRSPLGHPDPRIEGPEWVAHMSEIFPVLFITDQRLVIDRDKGPDKLSTRADEAALQVAREISSAKALYANRSQALDRNFPQRVAEAISNPPEVSDNELRRRMESLAQRRRNLESVGLLAAEKRNEFEGIDIGQPHVKAVISTYIDDTQNKLETLEPLRTKLQLFSDFLDQHYRHKSIIIDPEKGFLISVRNTETPLSPGQLSSGEQQIMVLAHQILFDTAPGTLVLIDEPELSLHVLWQATLVEDLAQMGAVNNLSFLLATHSPTLIGGREDLKRSLDVIGRQ